MSRLLPESKPFALHKAFSAATQSGAPFDATRHFSWPLMGRAPGIRATAPAASFAPCTVDLAASPATLLIPSTFLRALSNDELTVDVLSLNQRLMDEKNPSSCGFCAGAESWLTASTEVSNKTAKTTGAVVPVRRK